MTREKGYYFVRWHDSGYEPAEFDGLGFKVTGMGGRFKETDFTEISTTPITLEKIQAIDEIVKVVRDADTDLRDAFIDINNILGNYILIYPKN